MMRLTKTWMRAVGLVIASAATWWACGGDGGTGPDPDETTVASVAVSPGADTLVSINETVQLAATPRDAAGNSISGKTITWSSSNNAVATVSTTGLVTAVANGAVTISAAVGTVSGNASVTVAQAVATVTVTPDSATVASIGDTVRYTATAKDAGNNTVAGVQFLWVSANHNVALVNASGLVTATGSGLVRITAAAQGVPGGANFRVNQAITAVVITAGDISLTALSETRQLTGEARDAQGHAIAGSAVVWTSSDEAVATVSAQGVVTAKANGSANIAASAGSVADTVMATVAQAVSAAMSDVSVSPGTDVPADGYTEAEITVMLRDAKGYAVTGTTVQLAVAATPDLPGATLTQPSGASDASGAARGYITSSSFGLKQITATADPGGSAVIVLDKPSVSFGGTRIAWSTQPTNRASGQRMNNMAVSFYDAANNVVTTASRPVMVALANNPGTANVYGTVTRSPVNGVVTFDDVALDFPGSGYTLTASVPGFSRFAAVTSSAFNMTSVAVTAASTMAATISNCDDCAETVFLGFDFLFPWYGTTFSNLAVSSNGFAAFSAVTITAYTNQPLPSAGAPNGVIAPFWDDLYTTGANGDVYWQVTGAAPNRQVVVEWRGVSYYSSAAVGVSNFNIILTETTNRIEFVYGAMTSSVATRRTGSSASIGVENGTGTVGLQIGYNQANRVMPGTRIILDWTGTNYQRVFLP